MRKLIHCLRHFFLIFYKLSIERFLQLNWVDYVFFSSSEMTKKRYHHVSIVNNRETETANYSLPPSPAKRIHLDYRIFLMLILLNHCEMCASEYMTRQNVY